MKRGDFLLRSYLKTIILLRIMDKNGEAFKRVEQFVKEHPVLKHDFLRHFGNLTMNRFRNFIKEQYLLSNTLPYALAHAYGQAHDISLQGIPNWKLARPLMDFLKVEHWGSTENGAHSSFFVDLADGLGIKNLQSHQALPETQNFVDTRTNICKEGPFLRAVSAIAFANEYVNQFIFASYLEGAKNIKKESRVDFPVHYFEAHVHDEPEDFKLLCTMIEPFLDEEGSVEIIMSATKELLDARVRWYDALINPKNA